MKRLFGSTVGIFFLLLSSCSDTTPKGYLAPVVPVEKVQDNAQGFDPAIDILFVVDDSYSMDVHQNRLARNIASFTSVFLSTSVLNYNIGVITTSDYSYSKQNCCGELVGTFPFVTKSTPNANAELAKNLQVGTSGEPVEKPFDVIEMALTQPNLSGRNAGFLRPEGTLAVVFITDANDQSDKVDPDQLYQFLVNLKGDKSKVLAYAAFIPSNDTMGCPRDDSGAPKRIEKFLSFFPNRKTNAMNLCDPDFGLKLTKLAADIVDNSGRVILLNRAPQRDSIRVIFGNAELPQDADKGWLYDPQRNAVVLGKKIDWSSQPSGSKIMVYYDAYKYDD